MEKSLRELLLKDLCARLPYGVKVYAGYDLAMTLRQIDYQCFCECWENEDVKCNSRWMLPYLRPLSSMTEEEKKEFTKILVKSQDCSYENNESATTIVNDWYLSKGFDVRGLIPMGLALEAKEDMYK